jgi:protein SCO1/2
MIQMPAFPLISCCGCAVQPVVERAAPVDGAFELLDHFGRTVTERSFGDRHLLVFFGFSHCAVVCPRELTKLGSALAKLGPRAAQVQGLYVTVDPERDDPATLRRYLARYEGDFIGLTGSAAQVEVAKKAYRVFAKPVIDASAPGGYVVPHTAFSYLMGPGGQYKTHFSDSLDASEVAERILHHLG